MPEENIEIVRDGTAAFNRGDVDAFVQFAHPDIEFRSTGRLPGVQSVKGREEVRAWCAELFSAFDVELQPAHLVEAGEIVVGTVKLIAHGKRSGLSLDNTLGFVWHLRDGLVIELDAYANRAEALEAMGLSE